MPSRPLQIVEAQFNVVTLVGLFVLYTLKIIVESKTSPPHLCSSLLHYC
jgi:hypothetical protein